MENNNKILNELKEIAPALSRNQKMSPYGVSPFYFGHFAELVLEKIKTGIEPSFLFIKEQPFSVPLDYFTDLPKTIVRKVQIEEGKSDVFEEMELIAPLLNSISKKTVYSVPFAYFENAELNKAVVTGQKGRLVSMEMRTILKYLVAAVIIGILSVGIYLLIGKESSGSRLGQAAAASEVKILSEQEIVDFLKTTSPTENIVSSSNNNAKYNDIKSSVSKMSDKEIQDFLAENGDGNEM